MKRLTTAAALALTLAFPAGAQTQPDGKISALAAQQRCAERRAGFMEATGLKEGPFMCFNKNKPETECNAASVQTVYKSKTDRCYAIVRIEGPRNDTGDRRIEIKVFDAMSLMDLAATRYSQDGKSKEEYWICSGEIKGLLSFHDGGPTDPKNCDLVKLYRAMEQ